jgi:hypothetical protein
MARFTMRLYLANCSAVGRGHTCTDAMKQALIQYAVHSGGCHEKAARTLATTARAARRGGVGEVKWKIEDGPNWVEVERC